MRVLWFCNVILRKGDTKKSGSWLHTMSSVLLEKGVELFSITQDDRVKSIEEKTIDGIEQWILPVYKLHNGLPSTKHIGEICKIVEKISPDIIHIWGIEGYWGLLSARSYIKGNILLEIQGIKETCARVFYGGLTYKEIIQTVGAREILRPSLSLMSIKTNFERWSTYEREMLANHKHISTHSDWVRAWVAQFVGKDCIIHHTQRIVRKEFIDTEIWHTPTNSEEAPIVFTMSSGPDAYKGIHDAIKALSVLKEYYPNIELRIAGDLGMEKVFYRKPGYTKYLEKLIKKYSLENNVVFLGPLSAIHIVEQMKQANVMVQTSYVESYSLAVSEAMMAGIPLVVSYAGAMPELAIDGESALFYTPSDYFKCAYNLKRLIDSKEIAEEMSKKARSIAERRNVASVLGNLQMHIYNMVNKKI